jgi:tetratricopeptide (TPR) repeat protein
LSALRRVHDLANPKHLQLLKRGIALQQKRELYQANQCFQAVLRDDPGHSVALDLMGKLVSEAGHPKDAIRYFRKALKRQPKNASYLNNLGFALLLTGDHAASLEHFRKALVEQPGFVDALCNSGWAYKRLNRYPKALADYEKAYKLNPNATKAMLGLGELMADAGNFERATELFRKAIASEKDANRLPIALIHLASAHKFTADDPEPALMLRVIDGPVEDDHLRSDLHHAAGKAQADLGNYDAAFSQFSAAKTLAEKDFDLARLQLSHQSLISTLTPEFFDSRPGFGVASQVPVFIVGMPRSGTTLVEQICSSHSAVDGAGELDVLGAIAEKLGLWEADPEAFARNLASMTIEQSRRLGERYLGELSRFGGDGLRIIDKMPHNFELLGLVALLLPEARIIHCQRSPLDNCVSCFTHNFAQSHGYNTDLATLGNYYREYRKITDHWKAALPLRIFECPYEDIVAEQETSSRKLIASLNLEWEDACLQFHTTDRLVKTPSHWQVRQPIYGSSVRGWKKYEAHLGPLLEALGEFAAE